MNYRMLQPQEWDKLEKFKQTGPIPPPEVSAAAVAEDDDGVVQGVLFLQLALHMEPIVIEPTATGRVNFLRLVKVLEENLDSVTTYYAFSDSALVGKMAKKAGLTQLPYRIWSKEIS